MHNRPLRALTSRLPSTYAQSAVLVLVKQHLETITQTRGSESQADSVKLA